MKLLFDQNLSPKLAKRLGDIFPGSSHVLFEGLDCSTDDEIWAHAIQNGFTIVTKDADYNNLSTLRGTPPKVIWLLTGNCTTSHVEAVFRTRLTQISSFEQDESLGTMVLN
jgi:predicted nuclease of predicted toxin-antitoxin system